MKTKEIKEVEAKRWPVTILLIIIGIVILLPLYMAIVIAVKQPSEMTNREYPKVCVNLQTDVR